MTQIIMQKKYEAANYTDLLLAFQTLDEGKRSYEHISSAAISFINIYVYANFHPNLFIYVASCMDVQLYLVN